MAKKQRKRIPIEDPEVPMSSMIDIVFLLLIYFIVTAKPIIDETLLNCDLPAPGPPVQQEKKPDIMVIDVCKMTEGAYSTPARTKKDLNSFYFNGGARPWRLDNPSASNDLRRELIAQAKINPDQTVIINCGPNANHQKLIKILDACDEAQFTSLSLTNDAKIQFIPRVIPAK